MKKQPHATPAKRGPRPGKAHSVWATKRLNRDEKTEAIVRGRLKLVAFFAV